MSLIGFEEQIIASVVGMYSSLVDIMGQNLTNFFIISLCIAVYAIILGTFYKTFSREKFFVLEQGEGGGSMGRVAHLIAFILKYTFAFPLVTFVWFMFLSIFLVFLGHQGAADVMYVAIAVVAATRITAYWDEGISEDLAKMLPLGLLAFFISDPSVLDAHTFEQKFFEITQVLPIAIDYFTYIVLMEWVLRILVGIKELFSRHKERIIPSQVLDKMPDKFPSFPKKVTVPADKKPDGRSGTEKKAQKGSKKSKKTDVATLDLEE